MTRYAKKTNYGHLLLRQSCMKVSMKVSLQVCCDVRMSAQPDSCNSRPAIILRSSRPRTSQALGLYVGICCVYANLQGRAQVW